MSRQKDGRIVTRTRYPGIFKVTYPSGTVRYKVIVQIRGFRPLSKMLWTLEEAQSWQAQMRDPDDHRQAQVSRNNRTTVAEAHQAVHPELARSVEGIVATASIDALLRS